MLHKLRNFSLSHRAKIPDVVGITMVCTGVTSCSGEIPVDFHASLA